MESDDSFDDLKWAEIDREKHENVIKKQAYSEGVIKGEDQGAQEGFNAGFLRFYQQAFDKSKAEVLSKYGFWGFVKVNFSFKTGLDVRH